MCDENINEYPKLWTKVRPNWRIKTCQITYTDDTRAAHANIQLELQIKVDTCVKMAQLKNRQLEVES